MIATGAKSAAVASVVPLATDKSNSGVTVRAQVRGNNNLNPEPSTLTLNPEPQILKTRFDQIMRNVWASATLQSFVHQLWLLAPAM